MNETQNWKFIQFSWEHFTHEKTNKWHRLLNALCTRCEMWWNDENNIRCVFFYFLLRQTKALQIPYKAEATHPWSSNLFNVKIHFKHIFIVYDYFHFIFFSAYFALQVDAWCPELLNNLSLILWDVKRSNIQVECTFWW